MAKATQNRKVTIRKNPTTPAALAKDALATFDVNSDQELNKNDIAVLEKAARANPSRRIRIADILDSNGEQSIRGTRKVIKAGFVPKRPNRPITVVRSRGGKFILTDGFHRTALALETGKKTILAVVRKPNGNMVRKNPGLLSVLADAGVAITSALMIKDHLDKPKKRTAPKRTAKPPVRPNSPKKKRNTAASRKTMPKDLGRAGEDRDWRNKPTRVSKAAAKRLGVQLPSAGTARQGRLFDNPAAGPAVVKAYRTYHSKGLAAAVKFIDGTKDLTAAAKRELKRELRSYKKPPTIGARDNSHGRSSGMRSTKQNPRFYYQIKGDSETRGSYNVTSLTRARQEARAKVKDRGERVIIRRYTSLGMYDGHGSQIIARYAPTKRNPPFDDFQGRPPTKELSLITPKGTPERLWCLGRLIELRVRGYATLNFEGKRFYLCADSGNQRLYIAGGRVCDPSPDLGNGHTIPLGLLTHVIYETEKAHLGDGPGEPAWYRHKFGEEGGQPPILAADNKGYGWIEGGTYTITPLGIKD